MNYTDNTIKEMQKILDPGPVPEIVNEKMSAAYARLDCVAKAQKRPRKLWHSLLVAAALCSVLSVTALASNKDFITMLKGAVGFFSQSSASGSNSSATTTLDSLKLSFEAMNATVNLSATDKDITFTVQNLSIDDNFINVFGTISSPNLRQKLNALTVNESWKDGEMPDEYLLVYLGATPVAKINGKVYGFDNSLADSFNTYFIDDNTVSFAKRMLISDTLPNTFTIELAPDYYTSPEGEFQKVCGVDGFWTITANVDLTNTKGKVKALEPQIIKISDKKLDLKKFSMSPLGTIAVVDTHTQNYETIDKDGNTVMNFGPVDGFSDISEYALRDSEGKWLYSMIPSAWGSKESLTEFTPLSENADSVTFIPLKADGDYETKFATATLVQGGKIEMNSISGYTIESYTIDERHFEIRLLPYGPACRGSLGQAFELLASDGSNAYDEQSAHYAIQNEKTDHLTGAVIYTLDFYQDQPKLQSASELKYALLPEIILDEQNSVTLPLT